MPNFRLQYDLRINNGNVNGIRRQTVGLVAHIEGQFGANAFRSIHYEQRYNYVRVLP